MCGLCIRIHMEGTGWWKKGSCPNANMASPTSACNLFSDDAFPPYYDMVPMRRNTMICFAPAIIMYYIQWVYCTGWLMLWSALPLWGRNTMGVTATILHDIEPFIWGEKIYPFTENALLRAALDDPLSSGHIHIYLSCVL